MTSAVEKREGCQFEVKIISVGDQRSLEHFLSNQKVLLHDVTVTGKLSSSKDFEVCLIYEIIPEKNTKNRFRRVVASPGKTREEIISSVANAKTVERFFITSFSTEDGFWYVLFWEEADSI